MSVDGILKEIISDLKSTDPEFVLKTIRKVRKSGNVLILAGLIDLLHDTEHTKIK